MFALCTKVILWWSLSSHLHIRPLPLVPQMFMLFSMLILHRSCSVFFLTRFEISNHEVYYMEQKLWMLNCVTDKCSFLLWFILNSWIWTYHARVVWSTVVCKFPAALNIWILALRTKIWLPSVHLLCQCWDSMNRMLAACFIEGDHGDGCMNLCMHVNCILSWIYSISADCKSESISATIFFLFCTCISEVFLHKGQ
jgi:hypothetical protein